MQTELIPTYLSAIGFLAFCIRWVLNWMILNKENNTDYSFLKTNYSSNDMIPLVKHIIISEWKPWWSGLENYKLKRQSNFMSVIFYSTIGLILILLITNQ